MEHELDGDTNFNWRPSINPVKISKGTGRLGNQRTRGDHLYYSIIKNQPDIKKNPGDMRTLVALQMPVKNHQLTLV